MGIATGNIVPNELFTSMGTGVTAMYDITVISIVVCCISSLVKRGGGIQAILDLIRRRVGSKKGAMLGIGVLAAGVDVATANNTVAIVMTGELAKDISRVRHRAQADRLPAGHLHLCGSGHPPYGAQLLASAASAGALTSFAIVPYCFYPMLMAVCGVVYILIQRKPDRVQEAKKAGSRQLFVVSPTPCSFTNHS